MTANTSKALVLSNRDALNRFLGESQEKIKNKFPLEYRRLFSASTFCSTVLAMFDKTPKLYECTPVSIRSGIEDAATLGFDFHPTKGLCYLVPFGKEAKFVIGWRGMVTQAFRTGEVKKIETRLVYDKEPFQVFGGTASGLTVVHTILSPRIRGERIEAGYATAFLADGSSITEVMWFDELEKVRKVSKMADAGAWKDWKEEMFRKVPLRRLYKYLPQVTNNELILETIRLDNENYKLEEVDAVVIEDGDKTRQMADKLKDKELPSTGEGKKKEKPSADKKTEPAAGKQKGKPPAQEKKEPPAGKQQEEPPPPTDEDAPAEKKPAPAATGELTAEEKAKTEKALRESDIAKGLLDQIKEIKNTDELKQFQRESFQVITNLSNNLRSAILDKLQSKEKEL